jgi:sec-independent protein translocase protein TatC
MAIEPEEERPPLDEDEGGPVKSFLEHLEDFRWALIKSCAAVAIAVLVCLLAGNYVVQILIRPLHRAWMQYPGTNQVVSVSYGTNRLGVFQLDDAEQKLLNVGTNRYVALELSPLTINIGTSGTVSLNAAPENAAAGSAQIQVLALQINTNKEAIDQVQRMNLNLIVLSPAQAFLVGFRVALYAGVALASPFIFYFLGQFALPALKIHEKKYFYRGLAFALPLFMCGVLFCYFVLMPAALAASQLYANWFGFGSTMWDAGEYIGFVSKFMLGMGLGFEMPVVILVLVKIGLLNYTILSKARPYMIVINLVLGAVLTTPEVFTQILMAVPLQLLYEISVWITWSWERKARKKAAAEAASHP